MWPRLADVRRLVLLAVLALVVAAVPLQTARPNSIPTNGAVFFIKVSEPGRAVRLTPTEACAIEAACSMQADWPVYILTNLTFSDDDVAHFTSTQFPSCVRLLLWDEYLAYWEELGTLPELRAWYASGSWKEGFFLNNLSNSMRLALLYNHGGIYLDTDLILTRPWAANLTVNNYMAWEDDGERLNNAALAFRSRHPFLERVVREFAGRFDGLTWAHNGPVRLTSVYSDTCQCVKLATPDNKVCDDIQILRARAFYGIPYYAMWAFYGDNRQKDNLALLNDLNVHGLHLWSAIARREISENGTISASFTPQNGSLTDLLAQRSCPWTRARFIPERLVPIDISEPFTAEDRARVFREYSHILVMSRSSPCPPSVFTVFLSPHVWIVLVLLAFVAILRKVPAAIHAQFARKFGRCLSFV